MLLDEIIGVIRLDQLLVTLDELAHGPAQDPDEPRAAGGALAAHGLAPIPDTELLHRLVPGDVYARVWGAGYLGMHALSFALRSRLAYLAVLSHLACLPDPHGELEALAAPPDADREADLHTVAAFPWRRGARVPVVGFAALGAYVVPVPPGACRAFDAYELPRCGLAPEDGVFCSNHRPEAWWRKGSSGGSRQATMFAFYFDRASFGEYDEASLASMVRDFLRKVSAFRFADEEVEEALRRFGLTDREELAQLGAVELRRRFLQAAHLTHPDKGGQAKEFVALRRSYDVLRRVLELGG